MEKIFYTIPIILDVLLTTITFILRDVLSIFNEILSSSIVLGEKIYKVIFIISFIYSLLLLAIGFCVFIYRFIIILFNKSYKYSYDIFLLMYIITGFLCMLVLSIQL